MCIEREKGNFKSREVNCLQECTLALSPPFYFICKYKQRTEFTSALLSVPASITRPEIYSLDNN